MQPLDKLAELARAHGAKHKEGGAVVESALSPNVREPCVQCRIVCRIRVRASPSDYERERVPSNLRLARSTTVSFIPRSLVDFLRSAISADISVSFRRSSA